MNSIQIFNYTNLSFQFHAICKKSILTLVLGLMAVFSIFKSVRSTKLTSIPICVAATREKYLLVPNDIKKRTPVQ